VTRTDAGGFEAFVAEGTIRDRCGQPGDLGAMSTNRRWYKACSGSCIEAAEFDDRRHRVGLPRA
jgi:hypothetical protein